MGASDSFSAYEGARSLVSGLLELARSENWDAFTEALPEYMACVTQLQAVDWASLSLSQQKQLAGILEELKILQDELVQCSEARKGVLAGELHSLHNENKLGKAYRM
ncbi:protein FliT [Formivibrio citricus]|uniref:Flagellar protein FliT n=1 Tax=Formivibrio citricus TaxID=83765 RepID=A0A1I4VBR8_9NEIS|nr:flagellar protein FliT [Formivibrio citricus]SFM98628.1 protein FliT [Formivibrio citricus]